MNYRPQATPSKPGPCYRTGRPERWAAGPRVSQESCTSRPPRLCECALAVRIHAARQNSQRLPATGLRPATVATLSRLASSRLVSSRLVSCHTTLRPYDPRVLPSSVPSSQRPKRVLSSSVTSFDHRISPHPRLVCLAPSHRVFSVICSLISSRSKPRLPDRAAVWAAGCTLESSTERSKGSTTALPAAAAELLHGGGDPLRPRAEAWCPARAEATPRADTGCAPRSRAPHGELRRGLAACLCRLARRCAAYSATSRQATSYAGLAACLSRPERRHAAQKAQPRSTSRAIKQAGLAACLCRL